MNKFTHTCKSGRYSKYGRYSSGKNFNIMKSGIAAVGVIELLVLLQGYWYCTYEF